MQDRNHTKNEIKKAEQYNGQNRLVRLIDDPQVQQKPVTFQCRRA